MSEKAKRENTCVLCHSTLKIATSTEIPTSVEEVFSSEFFVFAIASCFTTSLLGSVCNIYLFIKFATRAEKSNGFQKLCLLKTIPNVIVCLSFLLWAIPLTAASLTYDEVSYTWNSIIGASAGTWSYLLTPMIQVCMSCNRFYVLYFPFGIKPIKKLPKTELSVFIIILSVTVYTGFTLQEGCGYVFDPEYFQWLPEIGQCADDLSVATFYIITTFALTSNSFNVATATRLLMNKMVGMSKEDSKRRRRKWMVMFAQSVIQDCLHLVDIINATYIYKWSDAPWYQFLFLTLSFIVIYTLDGFVMLVFHKDIQPKWWKRFIQKKTIGGTSVMVTSFSVTSVK